MLVVTICVNERLELPDAGHDGDLRPRTIAVKEGIAKSRHSRCMEESAMHPLDHAEVEDLRENHESRGSYMRGGRSRPPHFREWYLNDSITTHSPRESVSRNSRSMGVKHGALATLHKAQLPGQGQSF